MALYSFSFRPRDKRLQRRQAFGVLLWAALSLLAVHGARSGRWTPPRPPAFFLELTARVLHNRIRNAEFVHNLATLQQTFGEIQTHARQLTTAQRAADDWRSTALRLERENAQLRQLVHAEGADVPLLGKLSVAGGGVTPGIWVLDRGRNDGIQEQASVADARGLLGRVVRIDAHTAQVLPLSAPTSALPVIGARSGLRGMLIGVGETGFAQLRFITGNPTQFPGETLLTAPSEAVPSGLSVGTLVDRTLLDLSTENETARVQLAAPTPPADGFVRIRNRW